MSGIQKERQEAGELSLLLNTEKYQPKPASRKAEMDSFDMLSKTLCTAFILLKSERMFIHEKIAVIRIKIDFPCVYKLCEKF